METKTYPVLNEIFELTLDGSAPENQPLEMVRADGCDPRGWKHDGPTVKGTESRRGKLVSVGYCRGWQELERKLKAHGELPEGQWREAFKARYPTLDGNGPIGFADRSWSVPSERRFFPYVSSAGESSFYWFDDGVHGFWRWFVLVAE